MPSKSGTSDTHLFRLVSEGISVGPQGKESYDKGNFDPGKLIYLETFVLLLSTSGLESNHFCQGIHSWQMGELYRYDALVL